MARSSEQEQTDTTPAEEQDAAAMETAGVATVEQNAELEHSEGGVTTRDGMDLGVPMRQGAPDEPIGPEDAFAPGEKRGDYSERLVSGPHMETVDLGPQADLDTPRYVARPVSPGPQAA